MYIHRNKVRYLSLTQARPRTIRHAFVPLDVQFVVEPKGYATFHSGPSCSRIDQKILMPLQVPVLPSKFFFCLSRYCLV
jgi:hypothetical protein